MNDQGEVITDPVKGESVYITGAHVGTSPGHVEEVWDTEELPPSLDPEIGVSEVRAILDEWNVDRVVWLTYDNAKGERFLFVAMRVQNCFYDVKQQPLTLRRRSPPHGERRSCEV